MGSQANGYSWLANHEMTSLGLRVRTGIVEKAGNGTREASALLVRTVGEAHACVDASCPANDSEIEFCLLPTRRRRAGLHSILIQCSGVAGDGLREPRAPSAHCAVTTVSTPQRAQTEASSGCRLSSCLLAMHNNTYS